MSLSISRNDPTRSLAETSDEPKKTEENPKKTHDFDFAGASYSAVHLPTGLIAPSKTQLEQEVKDTVTSGTKVLEDLKSPELQKLLKNGVAVGIDVAKLAKDIGSLAVDGAKACTGDPLSIAKAVLGIGQTFADSLRLGLDLKDYDKANTPEARAKNAAKLHTDMNKFTAAAPIRFVATGRI